MTDQTLQQPYPVETATPDTLPPSQRPVAPPPVSPHDAKHAMDTEEVHAHGPHQLRLYSHSPLLYWWPAFVVGYIMALLTYLQGKPEQIAAPGMAQELIHPSSNLGVLYLLALFMVIVITNFSVRGLASGIVILTALLLTVVLAYIGWWDNVFAWFGNLKIHLTLGAYFWFSTLLLLAWVVTVFGLDRMHYWEVTPGQLTRKSLFGAGSQSYNAQGMVLEKHRDDLFRHWLLGLGSGDLLIRTSGATHEQIDVPNVLFVGSKVTAMQKLIAEVPEGPHDD